MSTSTRTQKFLTRDEAIVRLRYAVKGTTFHMLVSGHASISEDNAFPHGASVSFQVGRAKAVRIIKDLFSDTLEERGARVRVWTWDDAPEPKAIWFGN